MGNTDASDARLPEANTQKFEYSKVESNFRVPGTRYSMVESLNATSAISKYLVASLTATNKGKK